MYVDRFCCNLGTYVMASTESALVWLAPEDQRAALPWAPDVDEVRPGGCINARAAAELREYLAGQRRSFSVPLDLRGSSFQRQVWEALLRIPFGETRSYAGIAREVGRPMAARAVGGAVGNNPIAIIVPCHRVVGANGALTGYAGGLDRKRALLSLEAGKASSNTFA